MNIADLYEEALSISQDYASIEELLRRLKDLLEFEYTLRNRRLVIRETGARRFVFFGDIHGDLNTLYTLSKKIDLDKMLEDGWHIVFLGDYVDRGHNQIETLVFTALLKTRYLSKVITLRGNHEPYKHLIPYPHDFPERLKTRFRGIHVLELYELSREVFDYMPILLYVPEKLIAVHGGPPVSRIERYDAIDEILMVENDDEAIEDILWSDPVEDNIMYTYSYRGAGKLWGIPMTEVTLRKLGVELIIRGHEAVEGYRLNHGGRVVTIFTMRGYYGNTLAACLKLDLDNFNFSPQAIEQNIVTL